MAVPKLHPAEAQVREAFAADVDRQADTDGLEPEISRAMRKRADMIRQAMPILDYRRALIAYDDALNDGPDSGLEGVEYGHGVGQAKQRLIDSNPNPPELERSVRAAMARGVSPDDIDLYGVTGIPDPNAVKSAVKSSGFPSDEIIAEKVEKELARQMALPRNAELRKSVEDFKAGRS